MSDPVNDSNPILGKELLIGGKPLLSEGKPLLFQSLPVGRGKKGVYLYTETQDGKRLFVFHNKTLFLSLDKKTEFVLDENNQAYLLQFNGGNYTSVSRGFFDFSFFFLLLALVFLLGLFLLGYLLGYKKVCRNFPNMTEKNSAFNHLSAITP